MQDFFYSMLSLLRADSMVSYRRTTSKTKPFIVLQILESIQMKVFLIWSSIHLNQSNDKNSQT